MIFHAFFSLIKLEPKLKCLSPQDLDTIDHGTYHNDAFNQIQFNLQSLFLRKCFI
jgi:hypothetical protein